MPNKDSSDHPSTGWRTTFRALEYRNYRLFFGGQGISLIGTWIQNIALYWLVYRLTGSAFLLGMVSFVSMIPTFLLAPLTGVTADRLNRRSILLVTQFLFMIQAFIFAALTLSGAIRIWQIFPLALFMGCVNAFDASTRQSFVLEMVEDRSVLGNAIALNSVLFNSARMVGPSVAGILVGLFGEGVCFLINGVSFLTVIAALWAMRLPHSQGVHTPRRRFFEEMREGFTYTFRTAPIRSIILFLALASLVGMPYTVLMPVFVGKILHGNSTVFGFLVAGAGVGALIGAFFLASRRSVLGLGRWIARAGFIFGFGLAIFSFSRSIPLSFAMLVVVGFGMMVQMASSNTMLQTIADDDMRGRVMSFYMMAFMGMSPFGGLLSGFLADHIGVTETILASGIVCMTGALLFTLNLPALRRDVHGIYRRMGIIPGEDAGFTVTENGNENEREAQQ